MKIVLRDVGKRFNTEWILSHLDYVFEPAGRYAITGPNGSGKSTLLQIIGGYLHSSQGTVSYIRGENPLAEEKRYRYISFSAPYIEVIEEMTLQEFLSFHAKMKGLIGGITIPEIAQKVSLKNVLHKQIRYYSSGMKQRVKLAQAFFSDTSVLLLDEPLTNLDSEGANVYNLLISKCLDNRTIIISSNDRREYHFCNQVIQINDFKENDNSTAGKFKPE